MSAYMGGQSGSVARPGTTAQMFGTRPDPFTNPVLSRLREDAASDRYAKDPSVGRFVAQSIDRIRDFVGVGIVFRSSTGVLRHVRLPARPGDLTVFVLFGTPPSNTPAAPPPGATDTLRHEAIVGGLGCTAAVIGWIGLVAGAFIAGPVGWVAIGLVVFDATASGAASVSCLESGVRVLNESRGKHTLNTKMDDNPAYYYSSRAQDAIGVASLPRTAVTSARALLESTSAAAAAARSGAAVASGARIVREVLLSADVRTELLNAVGAGIGLAGSAVGGVVRESLDSLPPFPTFTIALSN
jgi:hypothetical protein